MTSVSLPQAVVTALYHCMQDVRHHAPLRHLFYPGQPPAVERKTECLKHHNLGRTAKHKSAASVGQHHATGLCTPVSGLLARFHSGVPTHSRLQHANSPDWSSQKTKGATCCALAIRTQSHCAVLEHERLLAVLVDHGRIKIGLEKSLAFTPSSGVVGIKNFASLSSNNNAEIVFPKQHNALLPPATCWATLLHESYLQQHDKLLMSADDAALVLEGVGGAGSIEGLGSKPASGGAAMSTLSSSSQRRLPSFKRLCFAERNS